MSTSTTPRRRPNSAWAESRRIVGFTVSRPPGRRRRSRATRRSGRSSRIRMPRCAGHLGQPDREGAEVGHRHVEPPVPAQGDGDDGRLGDQRAGEAAVVVADDDVLHRAVGHEPADLPEVAGGRVPAGDHDLDLPGDLLDLLEDVRAEQHGAALGAHPAQQGHQVQPLAGVDAVERLVEQEHGRVVDEGGGELDPLPHPLGVGADPAAGRLGHLDDRRAPARSRRRGRRARAARRWPGRTGDR